MKKTPYLTLLLSCAIILVGCIDDPDLDTPEAVPIIVDYSLYVYYSKLPQADLSIEDGEIIKDILKLTVSFIGGCHEHEFTLIASTGYEKDNPPIAHVLLAHNNKDDTCTDKISKTLLFDLSPLKEFDPSGMGKFGTILIPLKGLTESLRYEF